jgi:tripartite-type tricarboxylate transporter receptor subunit TctC
VRPGILISLLLGAALLVPGTTFAQAYPSKPVRLILNVSVGVLADVVMRAGAIELSRQTGQPWVVENRQGGNFVIGANACKASPPDGYTVCLVNEQSMSTNPHIIAKLSYDPERDFAPITNLFVQVSAVVSAPSLNSLGELRKSASASPGKMNFATLGPGTSQDILRQWMNNAWKTQFVGVPYKGMNLILNGIVAGETTLTQTSMGSVGPYLQGDRIKLLAVNSSERLSKFPDVPTYDEVGLGEFQQAKGHTWWGLVAPAGVPEPMVQRLQSEFSRLFREPRFVELLDSQFLQSAIGTPAEFAAFMRKDRERAAQVVKRFNIPRQ